MVKIVFCRKDLCKDAEVMEFLRDEISSPLDSDRVDSLYRLADSNRHLPFPDVLPTLILSHQNLSRASRIRTCDLLLIHTLESPIEDLSSLS